MLDNELVRERNVVSEFVMDISVRVSDVVAEGDAVDSFDDVAEPEVVHDQELRVRSLAVAVRDCDAVLVSDSDADKVVVVVDEEVRDMSSVIDQVTLGENWLTVALCDSDGPIVAEILRECRLAVSEIDSDSEGDALVSFESVSDMDASERVAVRDQELRDSSLSVAVRDCDAVLVSDTVAEVVLVSDQEDV